MREIIEIVMTVMEVLVSIALIAVVLLQSGKEAGLSGAISGGNADTYLGKNKASSWDQKLASWTKWIALVWILLTLGLSII